LANKTINFNKNKIRISRHFTIKQQRQSVASSSGRFRFLVPPSETTCLSTSHLRRHSRFSDYDSRRFCFPVPTKTLSYDLCVTITILHLSLLFRLRNDLLYIVSGGALNSTHSLTHCLDTRGHFEGKRVRTSSPLLKCLRTHTNLQYIHYGRHCKPFFGQNARDRRICHIPFQNLFRGYTPEAPQWEG